METHRKDDLIFELERRYLECSICTEIFDDEKLVPRLLPCQHTFCSNCLFKLCRKNEIKCPSCNAVYKLTKNGVNSLPKDNTRRDLLYFLQNKSWKSQSTTISCTMCKKYSKCQFKCVSCEQMFCDRCKIKHVAKHPYHWTVKTIDPNGEGNFNTCKNPQHTNAQLNFFCLTCNTSICDLCRITEHSDIKYHETEEITQIVEKQKHDLRSSTFLLEQKILNLKYQELKIKDKKERLRRHCQEYTENVNRVYNKETQILKQQKEILLENQKILHESLKKEIDDQRRKIEEYLANAEDCCKVSNQLLIGNDTEFFLSANKTIYSHVHNFLDESFEIAENEFDMKLKSVDKSLVTAEKSMRQMAKINAELQLPPIDQNDQEIRHPAAGHFVGGFTHYITLRNPVTGWYQYINMFVKVAMKLTGKGMRQMRAFRQKWTTISETLNANTFYQTMMEVFRVLMVMFLVYFFVIVPLENFLAEHYFSEGKFNTLTNSHFACRSKDNKTVANVPKRGLICGTKNRPFKYEGVFANGTLKPGEHLDFTVQFQKNIPQHLVEGTIVFEFGLVLQSVGSVYLFGNNIFSISGYLCKNRLEFV